MVICQERGADLQMAQLMPRPLTVSCFSKIQSGFTFLVPAHPGSPRKRAIKRVCVCVCGYRAEIDQIFFTNIWLYRYDFCCIFITVVYFHFIIAVVV